MDYQLTDIEARILGSLMEKSLATPEYYPLSLNALINACNQKSSREPVTNYDETAVQNALDELCAKGIAFKSLLSRVPKFEEHFSKGRNLVPKEIAVLCVLLLRGPQTVGELRGRTAKMHAFETLEEVLEAIETLAEYGLVRQLERLPGRKEPRYTQLLSAIAAQAAATEDVPKSEAPSDTETRLAKIEATVETLQEELEILKQAFAEFRKQFE